MFANEQVYLYVKGSPPQHPSNWPVSANKNRSIKNHTKVFFSNSEDPD